MKLTKVWWKWIIGFFPLGLLIVSVVLSLCGVPLTKGGDPLNLIPEGSNNYIGFYIFLVVAQIIWLAWGGEALFEQNENEVKFRRHSGEK